MGPEDLHEEKYSHMKVTRDLNLVEHPLANSTFGHCMYSIDIYPSSEFEATYNTNTPEVFAIVVAVTFTCVALVFIIYDVLVNRRNNRLLANAARSNAVVTSLFPGTMRDRILEAQEHKGTKGKMKSLIAGDSSASNGAANQRGAPLADLFLETTIMVSIHTCTTAKTIATRMLYLIILGSSSFCSF